MSKGLGDIVHSWKRCCCVFHIFGKLSLSEAFYWRLMFHHPRNWKISPCWNLHEKMLGRSFLLTEDYIGKMHSNLKSDRKQTFQRKPLSGEIVGCRNRFDKELKTKFKGGWIAVLMWVYHKDPKCQSWMFWSDCHCGQNIVDIEICQMSSQWKNFHFLLWRTNNADELGNLSLKVGKKDEFFISRGVMHRFFFQERLGQT